MNYLSVCSGIEAASCAWGLLGWKAAAFSEIEAFPSAVLAHHYPNVPNYGDMTKFKDWPDAAIDLLVGGTPCQSFSVAGLRKGLDDPRGNLMLTYLAIADRYRPRWLVWENVPGVLSSGGGRDFGTFLGGLAELGYGFAYRVLDAQYFGVPQRRRRVFVVGHLGDWRRAAAVLFEQHSLSGHPPPRREAGKGSAANIARSVALRGRESGATAELGDDIGMTLRASGGGGDKAHALIPMPHADLCPAIKARDSKGVSSDGDGDGAILVPMVAPTLRAGGNSTGGDRPYGTDVDTCDSLIPVCAGTLGANHGNIKAEHAWTGQLVPFDTTQITSAANFSNPKAGDPCHPLAAGAHAPAVAFNWQGGGKQTTLGANTLGANTLGANTLGANTTQAVAAAMKVRRLTPRECERLQGFPDGWTDVPYRGKPAADGPRYKALGNSMAVPVMRWIGERISAVDQITESTSA